MHPHAVDRANEPMVPTALAVVLVTLSLLVAGTAVVAVARRAHGSAAASVVASPEIATGTGTADGMLPASLAGLPATARITGTEAVDVVTGLHFGDVPVDEAEVAEYGGGRAIVWLSWSASVSAAALVARMTDRIAAGDTPFSSPRKVSSLRGVYATAGNGQVHYYFSRGGAVWWLAADRGLARRALAEVLGAAG